ncbi:MAG TPA: methyltransferase domain-containing protein [Candidatus Methylomirabilis sp.]|nr:methyltransferase domain-containing protein [Candidatus Methylomirabilis sp.]
MSTYSFDNAWSEARQRLRGLEQLLDPGSVRHLDALGVAEGCRCLEVGAGAGSMTAWLCRRVGKSGQVLATDLDTRFLEALHLPNLEVRRHDVASEDLPDGGFDLVLSRMVLGHIRERERALTRMAAALKPGGWLVCEDGDNTTVALVSPTDEASRELFAKVERGKDRVMAARGHRYCGRELYVFLCGAGLAEVRAEGRVPLLYAGTAAAEWKRLSVEQLRGEIVQAGLATESEIEAYLALVGSRDFVAQGFLVTTAWGQRPARNAA